MNGQTLLTVTEVKVCVIDYINFKKRIGNLIEKNELLKEHTKPEDIANKVEVSLALRREFLFQLPSKTRNYTS